MRRMPNIILTGLMGSGKSSAGRLLARRLGYGFIDTDRLIEQETGLSVKSIFKKHGEACFRNWERRVCRRLRSEKNKVISTGGGMVLNPDNMKDLGRNGVIVNLRAGPEVLWQRVSKAKNRPLLSSGDGLKRMRSLWRIRKRYYDRSDIIVRTDALSIGETAEKVIGRLKRLKKI